VVAVAPMGWASVDSAPRTHALGKDKLVFTPTTRRALCAVAAGLAVGAAGCAAPGTPASQPLVASTAAATPKKATAASTRAAAVALAKATAAKVKHAGLTKADLPPGFTVKLAPAGDRLLGSVSLDFCRYRFTTEAHRTARRETEVYVDGRDAGLGEETIGYDSPARAALALREWRAAVARCAQLSKAGHSVDGVRYSELRVTTEPGLPAIDNAVITWVATGKVASGRTRHAGFAVVLQRSGAVLDGVFAVTSDASGRELAPTVELLAQITGLRLTAP
jgi:hypothetical protein